MSQERQLGFELNGAGVACRAENHETLLEVLRSRFAQYGVRESCGLGVCGSCTVVVDGDAVSACLMPAFMADGTSVVTSEGLSEGDELHPVAQAFIDEFAFQCGFCTPGMVVMASRLLREDPDPSDDDIRAYLGGNLCRCGCYPEIIRAVRRAATTLRSSGRHADDPTVVTR